MELPRTSSDDPRVKRLEESKIVSVFMDLVQKRTLLANHQASTLGRDLTFVKAVEMTSEVDKAKRLLYAAIIDELS